MTLQWIRQANELTRKVLNARSEIDRLAPQLSPLPPDYAQILANLTKALTNLDDGFRYLRTRRSTTTIEVNNEADLQDIIFLIIKPWLPDLIYENPTDKIASRFVIKDFLTKELRTVIEAKYIRDKTHGKSISKELHDDIETYRNHPDCSNLFFVIYDHDKLIPDISALKRQIDVIRTYDGKPVHVRSFITS